MTHKPTRKTLFFYGDHTPQVHPEIMQAMIDANNESPHARSYLRDDHTQSLNIPYAALFGRTPEQVHVYPLVNGTSANATSIASMLARQPEGGIVYCAQNSHMNIWENGAPETISHGHIKLVGVPDGKNLLGGNKVDAATLDQLITTSVQGSKHKAPLGLSISFPTESGEVYTRDELKALRAVAYKHHLLLHIDGARLATGLVAAGMSAREFYALTRPDVLTFGQMKNGGFCEGVVLFNDQLAQGFERVLTSSAHMITRARMYSASMHAYIENGLWLHNAKAGIDAAHTLQRKIKASIEAGQMPGLTLHEKSATNRVSISGEETLLKALDDSEICMFHRGGTTARLMTSYNTTEAEMDALITRMGEITQSYAKASPGNKVDEAMLQPRPAITRQRQ